MSIASVRQHLFSSNTHSDQTDQTELQARLAWLLLHCTEAILRLLASRANLPTLDMLSSNERHMLSALTRKSMTQLQRLTITDDTSGLMKWPKQAVETSHAECYALLLISIKVKAETETWGRCAVGSNKQADK